MKKLFVFCLALFVTGVMNAQEVISKKETKKAVTEKTEKAKKDAEKVKSKAKQESVEIKKDASKAKKDIKAEASKTTKEVKKEAKTKKEEVKKETKVVKETAAEKKAKLNVKDKATGTYNGKTVYTGPKGGKYYINSNGNKTYIDQK